MIFLELPRHALNREQTALYETHVQRGVEILRSNALLISDDIISIVLEHHENASGQGYPAACGISRPILLRVFSPRGLFFRAGDGVPQQSSCKVCASGDSIY